MQLAITFICVLKRLIYIINLYIYIYMYILFIFLYIPVLFHATLYGKKKWMTASILFLTVSWWLKANLWKDSKNWLTNKLEKGSKFCNLKQSTICVCTEFFIILSIFFMNGYECLYHRCERRPNSKRYISQTKSSLKRVWLDGIKKWLGDCFVIGRAQVAIVSI